MNLMGSKGLPTSPAREYAEEITSSCRCSTSVVWLGRAASFAHCRSKMVLFVTFITACKRRILNKLSSSLYLMGTPSAGEMLWRKTRVTATRKRLKITGARTQPCLTHCVVDCWEGCHNGRSILFGSTMEQTIFGPPFLDPSSCWDEQYGSWTGLLGHPGSCRGRLLFVSQAPTTIWPEPPTWE